MGVENKGRVYKERRGIQRQRREKRQLDNERYRGWGRDLARVTKEWVQLFPYIRYSELNMAII